MPWNKPLARHLPLKDGRTLHTLHDARDVFASGVFAGVTHDPPLEHAIELLIRAAETGEDNDVEAATDQVAIMLRLWRMMAR
jgi:hypothetical protein